MLAMMLLQAAGDTAVKMGSVEAFAKAFALLGREWFAYGGEAPMRFFTIIDYHQYFVVSCFIFCLGLYGVVARRNAISMLLAMELMLNAVNINMSAFNQYWGPVMTRAAFTSEDTRLDQPRAVLQCFRDHHRRGGGSGGPRRSSSPSTGCAAASCWTTPT